MAIQNQAQGTGSQGQTIAKLAIQRSGLWVARDQPQEDFGIDLEMELNTPEVLGHFIKVQVKATQSVKLINGSVNQSLKKSFLRYVHECRVPIILVVVELDTESCWAVWLQHYLIAGKLTGDIYEHGISETMTIRIPAKQTLVEMLKFELPAVANWENKVQQYIALKDLAKLSLKLYDKELASFLHQHLEKFPEYESVSYLDELIGRLAKLGDAAYGTFEGNKVNDLLYALVRERGTWLTTENMINITIRNGEYSRTGLIALSILYDDHPQYAVSLDLPTAFRKEQRYRLEVYCRIREKYLGEESPYWLRQRADHSTVEIHADFTEDLSELETKWYNRGDSLFFDLVGEKF